MIPSVGETINQCCSLVGVALGTITVELRLSFIPCDQQFHSSVYTQEKCIHMGARRWAQGDLYGTVSDSKCLEATQMSHNPKHGCTD